MLLLGAGGAATGIAHALLAEDIQELVISNRTSAKAEELARELRQIFPNQQVNAGPADATGFDLVINGTALGLKAQAPLPLPVETLAHGTVVGEVVTR
ncbi:hypothetical protein [Pseudomonas rustica]